MGYVNFIFTPKAMKYTTHVANLPTSPYFTFTSSTRTSMSYPLFAHRDALTCTRLITALILAPHSHAPLAPYPRQLARAAAPARPARAFARARAPHALTRVACACYSRVLPARTASTSVSDTRGISH